MKSASVFSLLVSVGVLTAAVACTKTVTRVVPATTTDAGTDAGKGPTTKPSGDDDDTSGDDDDDTTTKKDAGKGDDDDTAGDDDDDKPTVAECKKTTDQNGCVTCCRGVESDGAAIYQAELIKCICLEDNCKTDCKATLCAATPKNPDTACNTCAQGAQQTCGEPVITACNADPKCKVFNACLETAKCATKPAQ